MLIIFMVISIALAHPEIQVTRGGGGGVEGGRKAGGRWWRSKTRRGGVLHRHNINSGREIGVLPSIPYLPTLYRLF